MPDAPTPSENGKATGVKPFTFASCYVVAYERLCMRARELGYALTLHGSLHRDLDIVAVPWTDEAVGPKELADALLEVSGGFMTPLEAEDDYHRLGCPGSKPHGRLVWSFYLGGKPYIDLSVMPRNPDLYREPTFILGRDHLI
jgi:hypothetical protein